ncbi:hypothetical protein IPA_05495 [Ignicoccus pacificus DSM 13166]|uniref:Aminotransferase class I/classII large domain-containing protein n=1 Tax=Ignicoccus pacificus DSM 13166 TaxID=940294 RepID=A0A977KB85_9CREN|nr:hypothetical protein IPA_05495 [Ignicoccus pacificus DSM 13166]
MECNKRPWLNEIKSYKLPSKPPKILARLHMNENPFPPPPPVVEAAYKAAQQGNLYPDPERYWKLRELAAKYYGLPGPEWVLPTLGSDTALKLFFEVCTLASDATFPFPSFQAYPHLASVAGTKMIYSNLKIDGNKFVLDIEDFIDKKSSAAVIDSPNNPTGSLLVNEETLERVVNAFPVVLLDEAYGEFAPYDLVRKVEEFKNLVVTRTMSKAFALAGFRMGFFISNPEYVDNVSKLLMPYDIPSMTIEAAIAAFSYLDYVKDYINYVNNEKRKLYGKMEELGWKPFQSYTNFVLVKAVKDIVKMFKERGVMVRRVPLGDEWFRVSIGSPEEMRIFYETAEEIAKRL